MDTLFEHRGYLVDTRRVSKYSAAVGQVISDGDLVADLGCGFGILGLLCLKAGAGKVWGIDGTDAIDVAREAMRKNGYSDRYECVHEQTFRAELPEKVDVIICDHIGYFGIDYGIIQLMHDARQRFLKPGGKIMPERLRLFLAGARSASCRGRMSAWETPDVPAEFNWLRSYAVNTKYPVSFAPADIVTEPVLVGGVELGDEAPDTLPFKASLVADETGVIDGIAGWFECDLGGGVTMTNSPLARDRIDRTQIFLGFDEPLAVRAGDTIEVSVRVNHTNSIVAWTVRDPATGKLQRYTNWASMPMSVHERLKPDSSVRELNGRGRAMKVVIGYIEAGMTSVEIEQAVLQNHPDMFPSVQETVRFVKDELARYCV
ncbi:50S ribosomal protein L11 methyltransferase [Novosphingobium sp. SL115]|uniref:50S ribosomal protein L11 methyltransferase n=1 Tax=Novosphingobium sp. SL115 TaxID=2995150 RepID=UPI00227271D6|nr:50S ribosomal protein L11 methyltransferase [Novosphingobium sp. SL115]MCY1670928.1 50S ribosomal protein L11 methyltransferase [Novosphingobium sp. SL115]